MSKRAVSHVNSAIVKQSEIEALRNYNAMMNENMRNRENVIKSEVPTPLDNYNSQDLQS